MKLILKKNHEQNGKLYLEGEEIEVTEEEYQYIMASYIAERQAIIAEAEQKEKEVQNYFGAKKAK